MHNDATVNVIFSMWNAFKRQAQNPQENKK